MDKYSEKLFNLTNFHLTWVKLKGQGNSTLLELWKVRNLLPIDVPNFNHIAITVKNINEVYNKVKDRKLKVFSKPIKAEDSNTILFFMKDMNNNLLEIVENKKLKD